MPVDLKHMPVDVGTAHEGSEIIEGIHVLKTRNKTFYKEQALRNALETWIGPYNKPFIKNHDTDTEPFGRVTGAAVTKSILKPEYTTARLYLDVLDKEAKQKLEDGRYQTFSIGASVDSVACSVCGKDILLEDFCGHRRGRRYDGNECYWIIESIASFDEISVVNVPSDPLSMRITNQVRKGEVKEGMNKAGAMNEAEVLQTLEAVDSLLAGDDEVSETEISTVAETEAEVIIAEGQEAEPTGDEPLTEDVEPTVDNLKAQLAEAQAQIAAKDSEITSLTERITVLEADVETKVAEAENLQTQIAVKETTVNEASKQNLDLAKLAGTAYREHAATLALFSAEVASREEADAKFAKMTISELRRYCVEALKNAPVRPEQRIANPTENTEGEFSTSPSTTAESDTSPQTVEDLETLVFKYMTRKR